METIKQMNLSDEERSVIMTISLRELAKEKKRWEEELENGLELKEREEDGKNGKRYHCEQQKQ